MERRAKQKEKLEKLRKDHQTGRWKAKRKVRHRILLQYGNTQKQTYTQSIWASHVHVPIPSEAA